MDRLPHEMQRLIFGHLDVNNLAKCGRVSRDVRDRADEVLSTITCIYQRMNFFHELESQENHFFLAIRSGAHKKTSYQASFTGAKVRPFLRFVTKKCPRLTSLVAIRHRVLIEDILPLADRITCLLLGNISTEPRSNRKHTIDADTLAANFPNLRLYNLSYGRDLCPNEVAHAYSLLKPNQLLQYKDNCFKEHQCEATVDVRSIDHLFSISARSPLALHELRPSSLNSLQFLDLARPPLHTGHLPHLPNLLRATLDCEEDVNSMIYLLHNAPKLSFMYLIGKINEESIPALNILLSKCTALKIFELCYFAVDNDVVDNPDRQLDFRHSSSLERAVLKKCMLDEADSNMAIRVILSPDCDRVSCDLGTITFYLGNRVYKFYGRVVSFNGMKAFAHPIELEIGEKIRDDSVDKVLALCPLMSRLKCSMDYSSSFEQLSPIFQSVLAKSDVSDILIIYSYPEEDNPFPEKLFEDINKYQDRSFSVTISGIKSIENFKSMLRVVSSNYTMSFVEYDWGLSDMIVKIPALESEK